MTDITELAKQSITDCPDAIYDNFIFVMDETQLKRFAQLLRDKFIAELGEPVAYKSPLMYGSEVTLYKPLEPVDKDELVEWYCTPLYALKDER